MGREEHHVEGGQEVVDALHVAAGGVSNCPNVQYPLHRPLDLFVTAGGGEGGGQRPNESDGRGENALRTGDVAGTTRHVVRRARYSRGDFRERVRFIREKDKLEGSDSRREMSTECTRDKTRGQVR